MGRVSAAVAPCCREKHPIAEALAVECRNEPDWRAHLIAFHAQINRLPSKERMAIVLCDLQGQSVEAAAHQLRWPVETLTVRLTKARARLENRLVRRGFTIPASRFVAAFLRDVDLAVPSRLVEAAVDEATRNRGPAEEPRPGHEARRDADGAETGSKDGPATVGPPWRGTTEFSLLG
jgi:hypothetical protein